MSAASRGPGGTHHSPARSMAAFAAALAAALAPTALSAPGLTLGAAGTRDLPEAERRPCSVASGSKGRDKRARAVATAADLQA
jgi:hypothetical protein